MKPFWKHQKQTVALGKKEDRLFDISDPGTGKTRAHLEIFAARRAKGGGKALISCPKTLMSSAWQEDMNEYFPGMMSVIAGAKDRAAMLNKARSKHVDVLIVNTDAVKHLDKMLPPSYWDDFDTFIIDEHSAYKHRTSQRSKAALRLAQRFEYRAGLTGTPNPNSVTELWHQMMILDNGKRLGTNFYKFQSAVCIAEPIPGTVHVKWVDREGIAGVVGELIKDITIRHVFEECMDIPAHTVRTVKYKPSAKLLRYYREMEEAAVLELERGDITAVHAAALRTKLLQIASGAVYDRQRLVHNLSEDRNELVVDLADEVDHSVVFFNWTHQRDGLAKELEKRGISFAIMDGSVSETRRPKIVQEYQAGRIRCLLMHPKTGAHGLTLTRGRRAILASPFYEADLFKQAIHRIFRGGQTKKTETIMVQAQGTVEGLVYARQQGKGERMQDLLTIIKESNREVRR